MVSVLKYCTFELRSNLSNLSDAIVVRSFKDNRYKQSWMKYLTETYLILVIRLHQTVFMRMEKTDVCGLNPIQLNYH